MYTCAASTKTQQNVLLLAGTYVMYHHKQLLICWVLVHGTQRCFQLLDINGAAACSRSHAVNTVLSQAVGCCCTTI
jgi:hypothetical protein